MTLECLSMKLSNLVGKINNSCMGLNARKISERITGSTPWFDQFITKFLIQ